MPFQNAFKPAKIAQKPFERTFNMFLDKERLLKHVNNSPNGSELKIFLFIALNQPDDGIRGYITTKKQLSFDLKLKLPTIFKALRWLKDELLIHELKLAESVDFMVNPYIIMNNGDRDERIKEWSRRYRLDLEREQRLKKERRLRAFRKQKKQAQSQNS